MNLIKKSTLIFYPQFQSTLPILSLKVKSHESSWYQKLLQSTSSNGLENVKPLSQMPGPKSYPIIGSSLSIIFNKDFKKNKLIKVFEDFVKKHGPILKMTFPGTPPAVILSRPDDIEALYRVTMNNPNRDPFHSLKKVRYEAVDNYFEKKGGILLENNEEWMRVRSRVQTPMLKPKNLHRFISKMDEITLEFMEIISSFQKKHGEMPANFQQELYKWALESVGLVALNRRLGCLEPNLKDYSTQMQLITTVNTLFKCLNDLEIKLQWWQLFPTPTFKKLKKGHELFTRIAIESIQLTEFELKQKYSTLEKDEEQNELALLEILLQTEGLSRKDVVTFIIDMLFAGIDTTSHTIGFTLYLLARNPRVQKLLQEEVDSVLGDGKEPINEKQLAKLSYLKCCVKESLRIFPLVIGVQRLLVEDVVISGYRIPKGCQVFGLSTIPSKEEKFFPRASEFLPERWGRDKPYGEIHPYASLPFSTGTRMCIGRRIAEQELYIFLARVMHRYNIDYKYKDVEIITRFVSIPSEPLKFQFTERR